MFNAEERGIMKIAFVALLLLNTVSANAHEYRKGYSSYSSCFKEIYREEYIAGTRASKGYVKSYVERVKVPCNKLSRVRHHYHDHRPSYNYPRRRYYQPTNNYKVSRSMTSKNSCNSSRTTGGLLGGGLAAVLSKKDAYAWSIPLGAVVGMGVGAADC